MPNSKNENQDKNLENKDLIKEKAENNPKKATEKTTQNKKPASQTEKKNTSTATKKTAGDESSPDEKKPAQKKSATADKKPAQEKSVSADKKPAQKKSTAGDKKPVQKKEPVKAAETAKKPVQAKETKAEKPQKAKKAEEEKEIKKSAISEESKKGEVKNEVIDEELENIKNIIQEDVNKIIENSNGAEWSDIVKESKETKDEDFVENNEDPADEPQEETAKYNYLSYFAIALFLITLISVIFLTVINWKPMSYVIKADNFDCNHKLTSAITQYEKAVEEVKNNDGEVTKKLISREIKDYYKLGLDNYSVNSYLISKYYTPKDLKFFLNRDISKINKEYTILNETANKCYTIVTSAKSYKDYVKEIDKVYKKNPAKYDKSFIEFYKYQAAQYFKADTKIQLKDLKNAESEATSATVLNLYYEFLAKDYLKSGDYDKVFEYTQKMLDINQEDTMAYSLKTMTYRLQKNYTKAFDVCEKGLKIAAKDPGLNQQMAVVLILQGKYATAEYYAAIAYNNSSSQDAYYSSGNVYALCAYLNKDETAYEGIKNNTTLADDIASIINGSKTIKEVFLDKDGVY